MRAKSSIVLIVVILLALSVAFIACDKQGEGTTNEQQSEIVFEYNESTGVLSWSYKGASGYELEILRSDGETYFKTENVIQRTYITLQNLQDDVYTATLTVHAGDKTYQKSIQFAIGDEQLPSTGDEDETQPPQSYSKVVERLLPVYYYRSGNAELTLPLTDSSGVESVDAYGLIQSDMYSYDYESNTLVIKKSYFDRFSAGFRTQLKITYESGTDDYTYIEICKDLPLKIEGLVDDTFIYDPSSADLKYLSRELIFFNGNSTVELTNLSFKQICIDKKELSQIYYTVYQSSSKIKFNYSFFNNYVGTHLVEVYTSWGKTVFYMDIRTLTKYNDRYPYNIDIDYDSSYPQIIVNWDIDSTPSNYIVEIADQKYYSYKSPELFYGCSFDATGKIKYGDEVKIIAEFGGKGYENISTCKLDVDISDENVKSYLSYENSFEFLGKKHNYYIRNEDELRDFVYYLLIYYDSLPATDIMKSGTESYDNAVKVHMYTGYVATISGLENEINRLSLQLNEAIKGSFVVLKGENTGEYYICGNIDSTCIADDEIRTTDMIKNINDVHYSPTGRDDNYEGFAINSASVSAVVNYSEELYLALERGVRPVPVEGSTAYVIYEKAKDVLRTIIDDSMTDYQKVHAMSDWLADNVAYDYKLEEDLSNVSSTDPEYDKFYSCRSLYLEGVFIDGVAVCNGYAKAMSLMCGIEGIPCYKIKGKSGSGQHAWNKVCAEGVWYIVDATWAVKRYPDKNSIYEVLKHNLLFISEASSGNYNGGQHYEQYTGLYSGYYAGENYNIYANTFFDFEGKLNDYVIDNARELQTLVNYYKQKYGSSMNSGRYIMIDLGCSITDLTRYISSLDYGEVSQYKYSVETYDGISATLKMTKK